MSSRSGVTGKASAGDAALIDTLAFALALEIRTMMDERDGHFWLGK